MLKNIFLFLLSLVISIVVIPVLMMGGGLATHVITNKRASELTWNFGIYFIPFFLAGFILCQTKGLYRPFVTAPLASLILLGLGANNYLRNSKDWINPAEPLNVIILIFISFACMLLGCYLANCKSQKLSKNSKSTTDKAGVVLKSSGESSE